MNIAKCAWLLEYPDALMAHVDVHAMEQGNAQKGVQKSFWQQHGRWIIPTVTFITGIALCNAYKNRQFQQRFDRLEEGTIDVEEANLFLQGYKADGNPCSNRNDMPKYATFSSTGLTWLARQLGVEYRKKILKKYQKIMNLEGSNQTR